MKRRLSGFTAEQIALSYERCRLSNNEQMVPKYVGNRKGLGYDIESYNSSTDNSPRFIEVKSLPITGCLFFTERERINLEALGHAAWLYLVDVNSRKIARIIQDPCRVLNFTGSAMLYKLKI